MMKLIVAFHTFAHVPNNNNNKNSEAVPGKHSIDSIQKTAILGTSHIIRKVLQYEA
jgi:hypothetical protein